MAKKRRKREKLLLPQISLLFTDEDFDDLDVAVLQSLSRLMPGNLDDLSDHRWPPENIQEWLSKADLPKTQGMLIATLQRWHELRRNVSGESGS